MRGRSRFVAIAAFSACCLLALPANGGQNGTAAAPDEKSVKQKPVELPKPIRVDPVAMPALPPAEIDDTLALGGEDIEAKKVQSRMTVAVKVNGTGPYRFVVDSGAGTSVIGRKIAATLQLPATTSVTLNGITGSAIVPRVEVEELGLGPTSASFLDLPVLDERDLGGDGMLGIDALAEERLMMDFEQRIITIEDAAKPPEKWDDGVIVVTAKRRAGQLILTEAKANGQKVEAVVDTGTEISIGNLILRDKLLKKNIPVEKIEVIGVTGAKMSLDLMHVSEIRLGSVTLRNVPIAFADVPPFEVFGLMKGPALLLGTDLMENFRRVSLDFKSRKVRFQLKSCKSSGMILSTSVGRGSVTRISTADGNEAVCRR